jgi:Domain of unknown function (DUF6487)
MICCKCNKEMEKGYIPIGKGINWRKIDANFSGCSGLGSTKGVRLRAFRFLAKKLIAYRCDDCEIISFQCGNKAEFKK